MQLHFFVKEASKAKEFKKKVMIGAGAVGAGIAGVNEYKRGRKNKKGLTNRDIQNRVDDLRESLSDKQKGKLQKEIDKVKRKVGKSMDENRAPSITGKALLGAGIGAYAAHKKLKRP